MRTRYRLHMTPTEEAELLAEARELDAAYARNPEPPPPPEDWEDEDATLRRAALSRGQP